jgi:acyl-CoA synthetase (AMP-forming)/AMP-acid ligase II
MDLSHWTLAFNGAEPVRADVMARFAELLAPTGFRYSSFYPCYGLAEATLIVTGGRPAEPPVLRQRASAPPLVGCGRSAPGQRVLVVDPRSRTECPPGEVGEVWVAGPSVARGYWGRQEDTEATFNARLAGAAEDGPFLRTGDLGLCDEHGELFVTGRIKDLIILRGANHYPQDIELTA